MPPKPLNNRLTTEQLRHMRDTIEKLVTPLESTRPSMQNVHGFIEAELISVALHMSSADEEISSPELAMVNNVRRVIGSSPTIPIEARSRIELFQSFLKLYPECSMSIDHKPSTIRMLHQYDAEYNTDYGTLAKNLFIEFAQAVVDADGKDQGYEDIVLNNFIEILNEETT